MCVLHVVVFTSTQAQRIGHAVVARPFGSYLTLIDLLVSLFQISHTSKRSSGQWLSASACMPRQLERRMQTLAISSKEPHCPARCSTAPLYYYYWIFVYGKER